MRQTVRRGVLCAAPGQSHALHTQPVAFQAGEEIANFALTESNEYCGGINSRPVVANRFERKIS